MEPTAWDKIEYNQKAGLSGAQSCYSARSNSGAVTVRLGIKSGVTLLAGFEPKSTDPYSGKSLKT